jgi:hypothetical protein
VRRARRPRRARQAALEFRALTEACAALCAGRKTFANPLAGLHAEAPEGAHAQPSDAPPPQRDGPRPQALPRLQPAAQARAAPPAPPHARQQLTRGRAARPQPLTAAACGACGASSRRPVDASREPAFLCRSCRAVNAFSSASGQPVEIHCTAPEPTAAGPLHYVTVAAGGAAAARVVSFPVYNASLKVVVGARDAFACPLARQQGGEAGGEAGGAGALAGLPAPPTPSGGCAQVAALPPSAPPLCVRLGGGGGGGAVAYVQRGGASAPWEPVREWLTPSQLPAFCAAAAAARGMATAAGKGAAPAPAAAATPAPAAPAARPAAPAAPAAPPRAGASAPIIATASRKEGGVAR